MSTMESLTRSISKLQVGGGKPDGIEQPMGLFDTLVVSGRKKILEQMELLIDLAGRSGQEGQIKFLYFFLHSGTALRKTPHLVLLGPNLGSQPAAKDVFGAVLVYEYTFSGWASGIFACEDDLGRRTVIAPIALQPRIATEAGQALIRHKARVVSITCEEAMSGELGRYVRSAPRNSQAFLFATKANRLLGPLTLEATFDETLAKMGKHTRRNLRYYRRKAEATLGCGFVSEAIISQSDYLRFNRESTHPVTNRLASQRHRMPTMVAGCLMMGLQALSGEWLSLIGYRRHGTTIEIDWQTNLNSYPELSLSMVIRAYVIEAEIERGTKQIYFEGGSANLMRRSFDLVNTSKLTMVRIDPCSRTMRLLASLLPAEHGIARAFGGKRLAWQRWSDDVSTGSKRPSGEQLEKSAVTEI